MPPHGILGLSWGEIGTIGTIVVGLNAILTWVIRKAIVEPADQKQSESIAQALARSAESSDRLQSAINELNTSVELLNQRLGSIDERVSDHGRRIRHLEEQAARHDERLGIHFEEDHNDKD